MNRKQQIVLALIVVVLAYFMLKGVKDSIKNFFASFGIGTSTESDATESQIEKTEKKAQEFSPLYWQKAPKGKTAQILTAAATKQYISVIHSAIGYIYDSPEQILVTTT